MEAEPSPERLCKLSTSQTRNNLQFFFFISNSIDPRGLKAIGCRKSQYINAVSKLLKPVNTTILSLK
jgi:hypothetical protein